MLEQLIGSKTRVKLLRLFLVNPSRKYYVREITRVVEEQINSVRRELAKLLKIGIIVSTREGNKVYYHANEDFQLYRQLRELMLADSKVSARQDVQPRDELQVQRPAVTPQSKSVDEKFGFIYIDKFKSIGKIELLVLGDAFNSRTKMGVDVVVVGSVNQNALDKVLSEIEERESKSLRFSLFSWSDFDYRRSVKDRFVSRILNPNATVLIDERGVFSSSNTDSSGYN